MVENEQVLVGVVVCVITKIIVNRVVPADPVVESFNARGGKSIAGAVRVGGTEYDKVFVIGLNSYGHVVAPLCIDVAGFAQVWDVVREVHSCAGSKIKFVQTHIFPVIVYALGCGKYIRDLFVGGRKSDHAASVAVGKGVRGDIGPGVAVITGQVNAGGIGCLVG